MLEVSSLFFPALKNQNNPSKHKMSTSEDNSSLLPKSKEQKKTGELGA